MRKIKVENEFIKQIPPLMGIAIGLVGCLAILLLLVGSLFNVGPFQWGAGEDVQISGKLLDGRVIQLKGEFISKRHQIDDAHITILPESPQLEVMVEKLRIRYKDKDYTCHHWVKSGTKCLEVKGDPTTPRVIMN